MISFKNSFAYKDYALNKKYIEFSNKLWVQYSRGAYVRYPLFDFDLPSDIEIKQVFKHTKAKLLSYSMLADDNNKNAYIYLCKEYDVSALKDNFKRNIKKAEKIFQIKTVNKNEVEKYAYQAFSDTRKRLGLSDFRHHDFLQRFSANNLRLNSCIIGAFSDDKLAAFASVLLYHDFLEIEGLFSCNNYLKDRPNDLLIFTILNTAINIDKMKLVSYGFSSIQDNTNEEGLHQFKIKCGFDSISVSRKFVINPNYKWLINIFTKKMVKITLLLFPKNVKLRKLNGILNCI